MHVLNKASRRPRSPQTPRVPQAHFSIAEAAELSDCILHDQDQGFTIRSMHAKSYECHPDASVLQRVHQIAEMRETALIFLTHRFENKNLRDEWVVAALSLFDRLAAARELRGLTPAPDVAALAAKGKEENMRDFIIELLAIVIIILKQSSVEAELDHLCVRDIAFGMVR